MVVFLQIVSIIFLGALGGIVWRQQPKDPIHRGFLVFTIALNLWVLTNILSNIDTDYSLLINKLVFVFPLVVVWSAMDLALKLSQRRTKLSLYVGATVIVASMATMLTNLVVGGIIRVADTSGVVVRYDIERGVAYSLYLGYLVAIAITALAALFVRWRRSRGREKDRLSIVGTGLFGCLMLGLLTSVVLPNLTGSSESAGFSFLSGVIVTISFAYAIAKYDLFDIKLVAVRSVAYGGVLLTLSAIYYAVAYIVTTLFFHDNEGMSGGIDPFNIFFAFGLAFLFQPIKRFFDRVTNDIFYRDSYDSSKFFSDFGQLLASSIDLRGLLERAAVKIQTTFKSEQVFFVLYHGDEMEYHLSAGTSGHKKLPMHDARMLDEYVMSNSDGIVIVNLMDEAHAVRRMLLSHRVALVMPLRQDRNITGYVLLGEHLGGNYTKRDLGVLFAVSNELIIAIQNALSLNEVKELNATLQQRIDVATKELRSSNAQLKHLDEVKDEFMSMASHQLRTPLTSIKGYLSMVIEGDAGKISPQQHKLLLEAYNSSERMVRLIADFLNVSRLQTGKFIVDKAPIDMKDVVRGEVNDLGLIAESHGMKLRLNVGKHPMPIFADEGKIRQVVMNFIDNAIYYSHPKSTIVINLERVKDDVAMTVVDTGIGVPEEEQAKLFTKFFRAGNARKARPDGTGVGLYLARRVITAHGGTILFSSKEGKGSTFGFRLPIDKSPDHAVVDEPVAVGAEVEYK